MKRKLLLLALLLQFFICNYSLASTSSGLNVEYIPASKNLGIGTNNPNSKLDINGQIMIRGGSPGTGKVLSSDANGKASWTTASTLVTGDAGTIDSLDSLQFLRSDTTDNFSSGVLITDAGTRFDVNGDLSIADTNISLDAANTIFTQTTGNLSLVPASGKDLSSTIASGGEFKINSSDLVFNGATTRVGIGTANPTAKLDVNGTIKGLVINGSSANFTNLSFSSINNSGSNSFSKVIVTNNVNGATANFTNANFTNLVLSGIINGSTSSFDGDFTNGSVLFSNANGVISQDNSHFYWDKDNKRLAINHNQPDMVLDVNGALVLRKFNTTNVFGSSNLTVNGANTSALYINKPSGVAENDLLIMAVSSVYPVSSGPSGWTLIEQVDPPGGNPESLTVYYKIATSSEPSKYSVTLSTPAQSRGVILRYTGADTSSPIDAHASYGDWSTGSAITPSITTSHPNTKLLRIVGLAVMTNTFDPVAGYNLKYKYETNPSDADIIVVDKDQVSAGATGTTTITYTGMSMVYYSAVSLAINSTGYAGSSSGVSTDEDSTTLWLADTANAYGKNGDLLATIKENNISKTIRIVDFTNGTLAVGTDAGSLDNINSTSFLRSDSSDNYTSGTLTFDTGTTLSLGSSTTLDINSTNVSIADTNISLDGANTSFTQSSGNLSFIPASGFDLNSTLSGSGSFKINTSDLVYSNSKLGLGTANPFSKLHVIGTIKGLTINGTTANFSGSINTSKLISSGVVNGTIANFSDANFSGTANVGKLISSGVVNGTTANFTDGTLASLNFGTATVSTLNSTTINNSGTVTTAKLISSGSVNGTTANFNKVISSGPVNGTTANFTNFNVTGVFNGSTSSFDGDFTDGSILFSNADGVISQNNSQLFWDRNNNRLGLGLVNPNEIVTINGNLSLKGSSSPSTTSGFGKLYSSNSNLYFQNDSGITYNILNGMLANPPTASGSDSNFQFNNSGNLGGNGALAFTKTTKTLAIAANAPLDINSTSVSIADPNISFDSASGVTFTPSAGQNLNISLSGTGDFSVNNNQLYLDTSSSSLGILSSSPNETLTVNGSMSLKEGSGSSSTSGFGKLYVKSADSKLYFQNDSGTETDLTSLGTVASINALSDATTPGSSSVYIGNNSGISHTTGYNNTAVGIDALKFNTNGDSSVAVGFQSQLNSIEDGINVSFGYKSLYSITHEIGNTAIGSSALYSLSNGQSNNAIGFNSLYSLTTGDHNVALGYESLKNTNDAEYNTAAGYQALLNNISGNGNTAIGESVLQANSSGHFNTAAGYQSLYSSSADSNNTSLGYKSLNALKHGSDNTALGTNAMASIINGSYNTAIGFNAGKRATFNPSNLFTSNGVHIGLNAGLNDGGDNNIIIGHNSGNGSITGSSNILIGYNNNLVSGSASNQLDIADTIYGDLANQNIGIGTASIDSKLEINGTTMTNTYVNKAFYTNTSGANVTINWNNGNKQKITLTQNGTFAFTAPNSGVGSFTLKVIQDSTGSRKVTWPASVKWPGSTAPTLSTAPNYIDLVSCVYTGTNYLCQIGLDFR